MMENNCCEAVLNNISGTRHLLEQAVKHDAERFVMISTDKAVQPESVMGATKRAAELLIQLHSNGSPTRCCCVRFGNVLGSRGSVVPIFLRQIAAGGPITITDEAMTRYFMTISDAVQLVLQAATLAFSGAIYMLDMGDPVKITDIARRLIELSGLQPDRDIAIEYVGIRPGEKLHEKLWSDNSTVEPTELNRIFRVQAPPAPGNFAGLVAQLEQSARVRDEARVMAQLAALGIGFCPQKQHQLAAQIASA
jgi:FlaA1/EpsC-like NDP-sugar epimerase